MIRQGLYDVALADRLTLMLRSDAHEFFFEILQSVDFAANDIKMRARNSVSFRARLLWIKAQIDQLLDGSDFETQVSRMLYET